MDRLVKMDTQNIWDEWISQEISFCFEGQDILGSAYGNYAHGKETESWGKRHLTSGLRVTEDERVQQSKVNYMQ